ncbi:AMP-binding protein [Prevotella sp. RM4]|uniref:AMP-binding protein n=1 Tax=Prevotella sp. RM4 TaxID=1200547 RepID=UPI00068DE4EA|nr:AMP-binding protein [Prevotella sp. RM4]
MFYENVINHVLSSIQNFPDRNAFCINEVFYSYRCFGQTISKIRHALKTESFNNKSVGLVTNNDIETYASIIALWLEGYNYVPLHPSWPIERCLEIISQVNLDLILDSSPNTRYQDIQLIKTDSLTDESVGHIFEPANTSDENLAYILFTSGSTGKPKGVQLSRKNLASFVEAFFEIYNLDENDRCLQCFELTFDLSIISYLIPLIKGACVYTVSSNGAKYVTVGSLIEDEKLTFTLMAPSTIRLLKPYFDEIDCTSIRYSLFCGEALHLDITNEWAKCVPNAVIDNVYGPTEDTIWCSTYRYKRNGENKAYNGVLSIGKPMLNCGMEIFDENMCVCQNEEMGELCLSGSQLTPGYHNNPEKNSEAFFEKDGIRWYRSGDLCYKDKDGDIMYSGRIDHQAKIQGFRVELGEIEFHAKEYLNSINVVCIAFDNKQSITEIAMFIESEEFNTEKLIEYMRTKMPNYMIPSQIIFQKEFALNNNGKIDKNILKTLIKI